MMSNVNFNKHAYYFIVDYFFIITNKPITNALAALLLFRFKTALLDFFFFIKLIWVKRMTALVLGTVVCSI